MTKLELEVSARPALGTFWKEGVEEFNQGRYWHAHERWEQGWKATSSPIREYAQAHIQACGVLYHLERGSWGPAVSLSKRALQLFAQASKNGVSTQQALNLSLWVVPGLMELLAEIVGADMLGGKNTAKAQTKKIQQLLDKADELMAFSVIH